MSIMSYPSTPEVQPKSTSRRASIDLEAVFREFAPKPHVCIYLLCIHCMDGVCISYQGSRTVSNIISLDPVITNIDSILDTKFPFFVTSCRTCMNYQLVDVEYDLPSINDIATRNQKRVLQLCLHRSIVTSSDMYTTIIEIQKVSPEPMCYNYGLIYVNSQSLFSKLDSDYTIVSYIAEHKMLSTTMHGGFF